MERKPPKFAPSEEYAFIRPDADGSQAAGEGNCHGGVTSPQILPQTASAADVLGEASRHAREGRFGVMVTVIGRGGSSPATPGQKMYLADNGECLGTVGGGALEKLALDELIARVAQRDERVVMRTHKLTTELGMCCGGQVDLLFEPVVATLPCLVVGAGHVARATVPLLISLGFSVTVADVRDEWARAEAFPPSARVECGEWDDAGRDLGRNGVVLVMTHDHSLDQRAVAWALAAGFAFVGGLGSRRKAHVMRERLRARGVSEEDVLRVRMPVGVEVGARLPAEIAVAIAAELVQWKRAAASPSARNVDTTPRGSRISKSG